MGIYSEPVYDIYELARFNLHIHTRYSRCAKPEMLISDIIERARTAGLSMIAITDHYNHPGFDADYMRQLDGLRAQAARLAGPLKILFGYELSAYGVGKWLETDDTNSALDYRLYALNHYQQGYWEQPADNSPEGYARHSVEAMRALVLSGRADCVAHPFVANKAPGYTDSSVITSLIDDNDIGELSELMRDKGVAWEINPYGITTDPEITKRIWNIGREVGATFHFGTDAHTLAAIDTAPVARMFKELVGC